MELDYIKLGNRIRAARSEKKYTQEKLSEITGISQAHIGHIETGKTKVALPTLVKIANALETTLDALLYDSTKVNVDAFDQDFKLALQGCTDKEKDLLLSIIRQIIKAMHSK